MNNIWRRICLCLYLALYPAMLPATTITLGFGSLPSAQGWTYDSLPPESSVFSLGAGVLVQDTIGLGLVGAGYRIENVIDPTLPFTVSVRVRVIDDEVTRGRNHTSFVFAGNTGTEMFFVGLDTDTVLVSPGFSPGGAIFPFDNTVFHDYRIEVTPGVGHQLFIDDILMASAPPQSQVTQNGIFLGNNSSWMNGLVEIAAFSFSQKCAAPLALSAVGAPYLWAGKGYDWITPPFVDPAAIASGYCYKGPPCDFERGVDCSGLVFWAHNKCAHATRYQERSAPYNSMHYEGADGQYLWNTDPIAESDLSQGDLIFLELGNNDRRYAPPGKSPFRIDHVAMFVGNAGGYDSVHASRLFCPFDDVCLINKDDLMTHSSVDSYYFGRPKLPIVNTISTKCPVDLIVTDPDRNTITANTTIVTEQEILHEVPGVLYYSHWDADGDGTPEDMVTIPELTTGNYYIGVVPEADAQPEETYSIIVDFASTVIVLAEAQAISEIPAEGYGVKWTGSEVATFAPLIIDIKPGNDRNSTNPRSRGSIPVAILTTGTFDATTVDPLSIQFGPDRAAEIHGRGHIEDVDGDGDLDLLLHFGMQATGIACGDISAGLSGITDTSLAVAGEDAIVTVGCSSR